MKIFILILVLLTGACSISCKKNHEADLKANLNVADNIVIAEEVYNHIVLMTVQALKDPLLKAQGFLYLDSGYATFDSVKNKISFYYLNKLSPDSVSRKGKYEVAMSGDLLLAGSHALVTFTNYFSDNQEVTGYDSMVNSGIMNNKVTFKNFIFYGQITRSVPDSILWQSSNYFKYDPSVFIPGSGSYSVLISGDASGTSANGYKFTVSIHDSLIWSSDCPWYKGDKLSLGISDVDVPTGIIRFNPAGNCTDDILYDFEGNVYYTRMNGLFLSH
jgi:hypothetical protein